METAAIASPTGAPHDGRHLRGERNRERLLLACRSFMTMGEFQPTVEKMCGRAGVTTRTFWNHFESCAHAWSVALDEQTTVAILARIMPSGPWPGSDDCGRIVRAAVFGRLSS